MSRPVKSKKRRERERRRSRAERPANVQSSAPNRSAADPVRGALAPVIDDSLTWHLARTAHHLGPLGRRSLEDALKALDVPAYRPRASEVVVRRNRRVVRHTPLLLRTLIIGVRDAAHLQAVQALPGVAEIVSHPEPDPAATGNVPGIVMRPAELDPEALQRFLIALAAGEIVQPVGIGVGQNVMVMTGPFASFPAVVEAILPGDRVKVAVSIFGRPSPVELGIADVQIL